MKDSQPRVFKNVNSLSNEVKVKIISYIAVFVVLNFVFMFFVGNNFLELFIFDIILIIFLFKSFKDNEDFPVTNSTSFFEIRSGLKILYCVLFLIIIDLTIFTTTHSTQTVFLFSFITMFLFLVWLSYKNKKKEYVLMEKVAKELNFSYSKTGDLDSLRGHLFNIGEDRKVENMFCGSFKGFPVRIFDYKFKKHLSERDIPFHFTFLEITIDVKVPEIVISSKQEAFTSILKIENELIKNGVIDTLEGDFSKFFSVKVEAGKQTEVRQILTPDIMVYLIDKTPSFSFLFFNDKFYICLKNFYSDINADYSFSHDWFLEKIERSQYLISKLIPVLIRINS
ncbi:MAG: hypothetical protein LiPW30_163 [Parcubacteria group bacterium LiPW_30]|nr:MAG: hypothetical protein LiPW30_163 [Parcubacteria group bacterium LiPW_30]